jgi:hypothetical protein
MVPDHVKWQIAALLDGLGRRDSYTLYQFIEGTGAQLLGPEQAMECFYFVRSLRNGANLRTN